MVEIAYGGPPEHRIAAGQKISVTLSVRNERRVQGRYSVKFRPEFRVSREMPEWVVSAIGPMGEVEATWNAIMTDPVEAKMTLNPGEWSEMEITVTSPRGAALNDVVVLHVEVASQSDPGDRASVSLTFRVRQSILAVKTVIGRELEVAMAMAKRALYTDKGKNVSAIVVPLGLTGYVFVETANPDDVYVLMRGIKWAKNVVPGETSIDELKPLLVAKPVGEVVKVGQIVEIVEGPFKGERAKVVHVDEAKKELTVELIGAFVAIPIKVKFRSIRPLEES